jgi:esterase/lipase superfamily enzyme
VARREQPRRGSDDLARRGPSTAARIRRAAAAALSADTPIDQPRANAPGTGPEALALLGSRVAAYLTDALARPSDDDDARRRLGAGMLELWEPVRHGPIDFPHVLTLSFATLVAATTNDVSRASSPRFDQRADLAMSLAAAAEDAGGEWFELWASGVRLGERAGFDLGAVSASAGFWVTLAAQEPGAFASMSLGEFSGGRAADARVALESAAARDLPAERDDSTDRSAPHDLELSPLPVPIVPRTAADAPELRVWFATNRQRTTRQDGSTDFTAEPSGLVSWGWCTLEPPGDAPATPPTSSDEFRLRGTHIATTEDAFVTELRERLAKTEERRMLVYIHGYRNRFDGAAVRAAQLAFDVAATGEVAFFSWPSAGKWYLYGRDASRVDLGIGPLADFLDLLKRRAGIDRVDVIVHSLGNRLFASAVQLAAARASLALGSVFLAAPDIGYDRFRQIAPVIASQTTDPATVYVSTRDRALRASQVTFNQEPRVGRGDPVAIEDGLYTIDASEVRATDPFGHEYFASTRTVLADIAAGLTGSRVPDERAERPDRIVTPRGISWRFRRT